MKVAVTGSSGFVGTRLVERLTADNHQAIAFACNVSSAERVLPKVAESGNCGLQSERGGGMAGEEILGCDSVVNWAGELIVPYSTTSTNSSIVTSKAFAIL